MGKHSHKTSEQQKIKFDFKPEHIDVKNKYVNATATMEYKPSNSTKLKVETNGTVGSKNTIGKSYYHNTSTFSITKSF